MQLGDVLPAMLERCVAAETRQFLEGFEENLLDNVLHLALPPGVTPRGGKHPGLIAGNQRFKRG